MGTTRQSRGAAETPAEETGEVWLVSSKGGKEVVAVLSPWAPFPFSCSTLPPVPLQGGVFPAAGGAERMAVARCAVYYLLGCSLARLCARSGLAFA